MDWLNKVCDAVTACKGLRRRLLIIDDHASHVSFEFLQRCEHLRIGLLIFPPHTTHRLQPLDAEVFFPLATAYTTKLTEVIVGRECRVSASKALFYSILKDAWSRSVHSVNIEKAFAKAGIYPLNRAVVMNLVFQADVRMRSSTSGLHQAEGPPSSPLGPQAAPRYYESILADRILPVPTITELYKSVQRCHPMQITSLPLRDFSVSIASNPGPCLPPHMSPNNFYGSPTLLTRKTSNLKHEHDLAWRAFGRLHRAPSLRSSIYYSTLSSQAHGHHSYAFLDSREPYILPPIPPSTGRATDHIRSISLSYHYVRSDQPDESNSPNPPYPPNLHSHPSGKSASDTLPRTQAGSAHQIDSRTKRAGSIITVSTVFLSRTRTRPDYTAEQESLRLALDKVADTY